MIDDPRFKTNRDRMNYREELDTAFRACIEAHSLDQVLADFARENGAIGPIYSVDQIFADAQAQARAVVTPVADEDFGTVRMQNVVPHLTRNPESIRWAAKSLGADNDAIFAGLGLTQEQIAGLRDKGIV